MRLIDKIHTISWDGKNSFEVKSMDQSINAKVVLYKPLDSRNKASGKGSRKYKHGLMVTCHHYKNAKIEEDLGMEYGTLNRSGAIIESEYGDPEEEHAERI